MVAIPYFARFGFCGSGFCSETEADARRTTMEGVGGLRILRDDVLTKTPTCGSSQTGERTEAE